ncbi:MAG TPA: hypothetical protein VHQ99_05405 [Gaiellaceae bacterium]|jgi:hypothetical protein|nr:hypothetical protein [Gaiellaceae bacterium]
MRRYGMYDASRGLTLALAAALAGLALWGATQVGMQTTGRFWLSMAIVAGAGLLIALANHVGTWTKGLRLRLSPGTFALAFLPVLVCVGWILIANQPGNGWQEGRLDSWSNSIGILGLVHSIGLWQGVLAFAFGLMLGLSFDGVPAPVTEAEPAYAGPVETTTGPRVADEPVAAERRYAATRGSTTPATPTEETAQTRSRTRIPSR